MFRFWFLFPLISPLLLFAASEEEMIALLRKQAKDPKNKELAASLAKGYKSLGNLDSSLRWEEALLSLSGTAEEFFSTQIALGKLYEEKKDCEKAEEHYKKAIEHNPKRAEPYYRLAKLLRSQDKNELCTYYALQGRSVLPSEPDKTFSALLDEELSIAAFYTHKKAEGFYATNRLLLNKQTPLHIKTHAQNNIRYYTEPLKATLIPLDIDPPAIDDKEKYYALNPSIQKTDEGYDVICRTVNYEKVNEKNCHNIYSRDPNGEEIVTRNFFLKMDKEFKTVLQQEILDQSNYQKFPWIFKGNEDCRLINYKDERYFICTITDNTLFHNPQVGLGRLSEECSTCQVVPLYGPVPNRQEKNWLPFIYENTLRTIYSYDPLTILQPDPQTGECVKVVENASPFDGTSFKGSAGPIPFDDGYLVIIHEMSLQDRYYYHHRFVFLDNEFQIKKVSLPFIFKTTGLEFCAGMTYDHEGKNVVLTLGVDDKKAFMAIVNIDDVKKQLSIKGDML